MKKTLTLILVLISLLTQAQYTFTPPVPAFGSVSSSCEVNANDRTDQQFRDDLKRSIFKLIVPDGAAGTFTCSGTLINRNTSQGTLGQYFITAWHCFTSGTNCSGSAFDFSNPIQLVFNYESPQSNPGQVFSQNATGSVYTLTTQAVLVDHVSCAEGDFALCKIVGTPIPPYYNVYYAGWYPTALAISSNGPFTAFHHPSGDIKKASGANAIVDDAGGPIATACAVVTKLIDFLFGWIWGHRWSTEVVCTYLDVPFVGPRYTIPSLSFGNFQDGSSGGGLFTGTSGNAGVDRYIGHLSGTVPNFTCSTPDPGIAFFTRLEDSYYRQTVKNTLNPSNDYWTDQSGIAGRQITCYPSIDLDATSQELDLYPASLYQDQNALVYSSQTTITTTGSNPVVIEPGSNYTFQAGQSITLSPGFTVSSGATFQASVVSACAIDGTTAYRNPVMHHALAGPDSSRLIPQKTFDLNKYLPGAVAPADNITKFEVFPNPSTSGQANIQLFFTQMEPSLNLTVYDIYGHPVYSRDFANVYFIEQNLSLPNLASGLYSVTVRTSSHVESKKLLIAR
jgi:Secretion system C-terminal sorting domain